MEPAAITLLLVCLVLGAYAIWCFVREILKIAFAFLEDLFVFLGMNTILILHQARRDTARAEAGEPDEAHDDDSEDDEDADDAVMGSIGVVCLSAKTYGNKLPFCGECGACRQYRA